MVVKKVINLVYDMTKIHRKKLFVYLLSSDELSK